MADVPAHVCPDCGCYLPHVQELEAALAYAEKDLRSKRAQIARMTSERNHQQVADPMYEPALEVFNYWRQRVSPRAREFTGERFEAVAARLKAGHSVAELKKAVEGAKARPRRGVTTDLHTICRNEKNLLMFLDFAESVSANQPSPGLEATYRTAVQALDDRLVARLCELRGYAPEAVRHLGLGFDRNVGRIVFPVRAGDGTLVGLTRWQPNPAHRNGKPKNLAEGPRELFPAPETLEEGESVWLVEGEPDALAMATMGQPAVAVPGVAIWKDGWEQRFARFSRVRILFDCDEEGRAAAHARSKQLAPHTEVAIVDLDEARSDHFDVSDLLKERGPDAAAVELARISSAGTTSTVIRLHGRRTAPPPRQESYDPRTPYQRVVEALEARQLTVKPRGDGRAESQCPNHDDRNPSLSITEGDDGRVLLHCHTGCEPNDVVEALGLEWRDLFAA